MEILYDDSESNYCLLKIKGAVTSGNSAQLEKAILDICQGHINNVIFDLSGLESLASGGLRVFLLLAKKAASAQKKLALCHLKNSIKQVFVMSSLINLIHIEDSFEDAVAYIESAQKK